MKAKVMTIGPEQARQMLERNGRNRTVNTRAVARYANDMREGKWTLNGEPLIFDFNGNLLDGQHRLYAVIEAGISAQFLVVTDTDPDVFDTIDIGNKRTGGDILSIRGYKYSKTLAAILRTTHHYKLQGFHNNRHTAENNTKNQRRIDHLELVQKYPTAVQAAEYLAHRRSSCSIFRPVSFSGAMYVVFGEQDAFARDEFFNAIFDMESEHATSKPILALRKAYESVAVTRDMNASLQHRFWRWDKAFREFRKVVSPKKNTLRLDMNARQPTSQPR